MARENAFVQRGPTANQGGPLTGRGLTTSRLLRPAHAPEKLVTGITPLKDKQL